MLDKSKYHARSEIMRLIYWSVIALGLVLWIVISWVAAPRQAESDVFVYSK